MMGRGSRAALAALFFGATGLWCTAARAQDEQPAWLLVGDSTLAPDTGYGDALCARMAADQACLNMARGGRSTSSYRAEGSWDRVLARLRSSALRGRHHVLIQFGHNDQPGKPGRSTDLATEFPANLARYVDEVRAAGGVPVLLTPLTRRSWRDGELVDDLGPWARATAEVARQQKVALVDLYALSRQLVGALGPERADALAQGAPGSAAFDRTHVGARGACFFAHQVAAALATALPGATAAFGPAPDCEKLAAPPLMPPPGSLNRATFDQAGWATGTQGGRGGRIVRVSTLAADGPGSLRAALEATGPRVIVFEVGGAIDLGGKRLSVRHPFVTVAGQTAPDPGVTVLRGEVDIATHDVVIQHLAFRPGDGGRARRSGGDQDGLSTRGGAHHVIVDHCSFSWATDENLSISGPRFDGGDDPEAWRRHTSHAITYSHNLLAEGLSDSVHSKGEHSKGTLVHDNATGVLLFGNLYVSNRERNPLFKGGVHAALVNNLIVNPGRRAVHYNLLAAEWAGRPVQVGRLALVGNVLRHGPDTPVDTPLFALGGAGDVELHLADNLAFNAQGTAVPLLGRYTAGSARVLPAERPELPPRLRAVPAQRLDDDLPLAVGMRPWQRDAVDQRILAEVVEGRGRILDSQDEVGGYPVPAPSRRPFDPAMWNRRDMSPAGGWSTLFR